MIYRMIKNQIIDSQVQVFRRIQAHSASAVRSATIVYWSAHSAIYLNINSVVSTAVYLKLIAETAKSSVKPED